jgi:hypothetical protein
MAGISAVRTSNRLRTVRLAHALKCLVGAFTYFTFDFLREVIRILLELMYEAEQFDVDEEIFQPEIVTADILHAYLEIVSDIDRL